MYARRMRHNPYVGSYADTIHVVHKRTENRAVADSMSNSPTFHDSTPDAKFSPIW